jgi:hypothetical protein
MCQRYAASFIDDVIAACEFDPFEDYLADEIATFIDERDLYQESIGAVVDEYMEWAIAQGMTE